MDLKVLIFCFLFLTIILPKISFSQEYITKICERGVTIYPSKTGCPDLVYTSLEEVETKKVEFYSVLISLLTILCLGGIFLLIYKKFLQK